MRIYKDSLYMVNLRGDTVVNLTDAQITFIEDDNVYRVNGEELLEFLKENAK